MLKPPPSWLRNAVIYHILIDRFAGFSPTRAGEWDLPVFVGGNLRGITSKLDYLVELGVNTLWLSPFCCGIDYHGSINATVAASALSPIWFPIIAMKAIRFSRRLGRERTAPIANGSYSASEIATPHSWDAPGCPSSTWKTPRLAAI